MQRIIEVIEAKLKEQEETIVFQKYEIESLKEKLNNAEAHIREIEPEERLKNCY